MTRADNVSTLRSGWVRMGIGLMSLLVWLTLPGTTHADRAIAGVDPVFRFSDTFPDPPNVFATAQVGDILAGYGMEQFFNFDRTAAMATEFGLGIFANTQRIDIPFPANAEEPIRYTTNFVQASKDWENIVIEPNPMLGESVFMQMRVRVEGNAALSPATRDYMDASWRYHIQLNDQLEPVFLSNPFETPVGLLFSSFIEVPVGEPFSLRQSLSGEIVVDEQVIPSVVFPTPEMYDAFGSLSFTSSTQGVTFFTQPNPEFPVEANWSVDGGAPPLRFIPPSLEDQLEELTRASIRGEIEPTFAGSGIITLRGDEEIEPLAANLPFRVVAAVESKMDSLRFFEITVPFEDGLIDEDEYNRRQRNANELSSLFRDIKNEPTFAEFRREATPSASEILVYSLLYLFFGSDPFYGLYTADQPITLPPVNGSELTFSTDSSRAGVTLELPGLWGHGRVSPEVLSSQVTVRFENNQLQLISLETDIASYEILDGVQTGVNHGFAPDGAQVWSNFNIFTGDFTAHGEGHITNDLYGPDRPIFVFQDISGRVLNVGGETLVEAIADNEPMIVPGLPGEAPATQPIAFAATRANFDAATGELRLMENTDNSIAPDVSVVLTPDSVFGFGLDNTGEALIGAQIVIEALTLTGGVADGKDIQFSDADFEIINDQGTFAAGQFINIRIDTDVMSIIADVVFDDVAGALDSPFIEDWMSDPGPVVLLGRIGTVDLLALTEDFTISGVSPTDFISLTRLVVIPEPATLSLALALSGALLPRRRGRGRV